MVPDRTYHASRFIFSSFFSLIYFLFVPCGGLSWLHISFLLHVKYTISYGKARNRVNASWEIMLSFSFALDKHNGQSRHHPTELFIVPWRHPKPFPEKGAPKTTEGVTGVNENVWSIQGQRRPFQTRRSLCTSRRYYYYYYLEFRANYCATSTNMRLVHWLLMGGLLHLVQRGGDWAGLQPAQSPPPTVLLLLLLPSSSSLLKLIVEYKFGMQRQYLDEEAYGRDAHQTDPEML